MTLSFSTKWPSKMGELAGQPNYFPEKIWSGIKFDDPREWSILHSCYLHEYKLKVGAEWDSQWANIARAYPPKLHTLRHDPANRWKSGMKIHPVINNRTKNRFQFAPVLEVKSVQKIEIKRNYRLRDIRFDKDGWSITGCNFYGENIMIVVDKKELTWEEIKQLAINDGFPSVEAFFQYFNEDFKGKIIHWTNFTKY